MNDKCKHIWRTNTQHKFKGWKCRKCGLEEHNVELVLREQLSRYEAVRTSLLTILDAVDYTAGNCRINEAVAAALPKELIDNARNALKALAAQNG